MIDQLGLGSKPLDSSRKILLVRERTNAEVTFEKLRVEHSNHIIALTTRLEFDSEGGRFGRANVFSCVSSGLAPMDFSCLDVRETDEERPQAVVTGKSTRGLGSEVGSMNRLSFQPCANFVYKGKDLFRQFLKLIGVFLSVQSLFDVFQECKLFLAHFHAGIIAVGRKWPSAADDLSTKRGNEGLSSKLGWSKSLWLEAP
jgi:hypothetical protein